MGEPRDVGKKCPMSFSGTRIEECAEDCAWWSDYRKGCGMLDAVVGLSVKLGYIQNKYAPRERRD